MMQTIKISLLKKESDINEDNKAEYIKLITANIDCDKIEKSQLQKIPELCQNIFEELINHNLDIVPTHVGIWIEYTNGNKIENAIDLNVLNSIKKYGDNISKPFTEFFNWTIENPEK
jgi:hypothetical protein